ncbi:uncharacterized protein LOC119688779 [Teleopsis dalmanni]|uniref:uncharacterized protein LOC119664844 n=1 Tax=Teleopsis dalmanni TaxID=139649 RepID=UPI0018CDAC3F|nr:uncharacterized protein LOC119664844 [Teleopsis dalmanni]XP_037959373.1 uncharacterized protein LOC119688779 [Teleopsis dalmanni]
MAMISLDTLEPINSLELEPSNSLESNEQRNMFLSNFGLICDEALTLNKVKQHDSPARDDFMILHKTMHLRRRKRAVQPLARCPTIPLTSPAGELLIRATEANVTTDYITKRLVHLDRFCQAPLLLKGDPTGWYHIYKYPRRQHLQRHRKEDLDFFNGELIKQCRPLKVRIKKLNYQEVKQTNKSPMDSGSKLNIKKILKNSHNAKCEKSAANQILVDTIDLCSSDEDEGGAKPNSHSNKAIKQ